MSLDTFLFIAHFSTASTLVPLFLGLAKLRSTSPELKLLLILTGVSFICDMASLFHAKLKIGGNYPGDVYRMAEFMLLLIIYYKAFKNPRMFKVFLVLTLFY